MFGDCLRRETHLFQGVGAVLDGDGVGSHGMPMVEVGEFDVDAVGELKGRLIAQQFRLVGQLDFVLTQMLHVLLDGDFQILGQDDQLGRLVEPLVVPVRMLHAQDVANAVVFPQPNGGHDEQSGLHAKQGVPQGHSLFLRRVGRVDHVHAGSVAQQRRELLAVVRRPHLHFALTERTQRVLRGFVQAVNVRHVDAVVSFGECRTSGPIRPEELMREMLGVVGEQNVGSVRFGDELLPLEETFGQHVDIGQFFVACIVD